MKFLEGKRCVLKGVALLCLSVGMVNVVYAQFIPSSYFKVISSSGDYDYEDNDSMNPNSSMSVDVDSVLDDGETGAAVSEFLAIQSADVVMVDPDWNSVPLVIHGYLAVDLRCKTPNSAYCFAFAKEEVELCWTADWDDDDVIFQGEYRDELAMQNGDWSEQTWYYEDYDLDWSWSDSGTGTRHSFYTGIFEIFTYAGFVSSEEAEEGVSLRYSLLTIAYNTDTDEEAYAKARIDGSLGCTFHLN